MRINIAKDYTRTPGGRFINEGPFSGEDFREKILYPAYEEAKLKNEKLLIDFDGGYGYATSFLEEAFGGLARKVKSKDILDYVEIKSLDEPSLYDKICEYIKDAF